MSSAGLCLANLNAFYLYLFCTCWHGCADECIVSVYLHLAPCPSIHPLIDPFLFVDVYVSVKFCWYQSVSVVFLCLVPTHTLGIPRVSIDIWYWRILDCNPSLNYGACLDRSHVLNRSSDSRSPKTQRPKVLEHPWKMENVAMDCSTNRLELEGSLRIPRMPQCGNPPWCDQAWVIQEGVFVISCVAMRQLKQRKHIILCCIYSWNDWKH